MEFYVSQEEPESEDLIYWRGFRTSLIETYEVFSEKTEVLNRGEILPADCDRMLTPAIKLKALFEEGLKETRKGLDLKPSSKFNRFIFLSNLNYGNSSSEEAKVAIVQLRLVALDEGGARFLRLQQARRKVGNVGKVYEDIIENLDELLTNFEDNA